jgi:mRNA transport regulator MTR2
MNTFQSQQQQSQRQDYSATIEQLLSKLVESLDQTPQSPSQILPQLHQQPRIIINGQPFGSRDQFQQLWSTLPLSNHQISSCDIHFVPSDNQLNNNLNGQFLILAHLKVRFDESGKNKLGDTALLNISNSNSNPNSNSNFSSSTRAIWSHWYGVSLSCVIDPSVINNFNTECISTWDYRFTENPTSSIFKVN